MTSRFFPVRIVRNPKDGHYIEIKLNGRVSKIDLSSKSAQEKTDMAHSLFRWSKGGYMGYPDFMEKR